VASTLSAPGGGPPSATLAILHVVSSLYRLSAGQTFADVFEIQGVLGTGSMGVVYRAQRLGAAEPLALKLMHPVLAADPKSVHRFEREARAGMSIHSRHVARVLEMGHDPISDQPWIAMELAQGSELTRFVEQNAPLSQAVAVTLLSQLFDALSAAHQAGVVHRDLKPDNIVVCSEGADQHPLLKVLDFGIAKSLTSATAMSTSPGQGTPLWTAPEQTRMDDVPSPTADVWALGLLTFYVLSGKIYWKHAHGQLSMVKLSMELVRDPIAAPTLRAEELGISYEFPPGFDDWFTHCVHRNPAERFVDATAAMGALMSMIDRRTRRRYRLWVPVYSDALSGGVAITHDVSDVGMLVLSRSAPQVGRRLSLRFALPPETGQPFEIAATVLRSSANDDDPQGLWPYKLALAFDVARTDLEPLLLRIHAESLD